MFYSFRNHGKFIQLNKVNLGWLCGIRIQGYSRSNEIKLIWKQYKLLSPVPGYKHCVDRIRLHTPKFKKWALK